MGSIHNGGGWMLPSFCLIRPSRLYILGRRADLTIHKLNRTEHKLGLEVLPNLGGSKVTPHIYYTKVTICSQIVDKDVYTDDKMNWGRPLLSMHKYKCKQGPPSIHNNCTSHTQKSLYFNIWNYSSPEASDRLLQNWRDIFLCTCYIMPKPVCS